MSLVGPFAILAAIVACAAWFGARIARTAREWYAEIALTDPPVVQFLDVDGITEVQLPSGWDVADVWDTVSDIAALPEVTHA